tara:strand:+ start:256 stop:1098 length:843 start_codon:yes stop_codon:yes gene_type:complete
MGRDYTKYDFYNYEDLIASNLSKRALVFEVVKFFSNYMEYEMNEIKEFFIDDIQGSKGFIRTLDEVKDEKRFSSEKLVSADGIEFVVSNQWGASNFESFLKFNDDQIGYKIINSNTSNENLSKSSPEYPIMEIPSQLFQNYNVEWGRYLVFYLENSPNIEDYEKFEITLDMENRVVIGKKDEEDDCRCWFKTWEVMIYEPFQEKKSYDGMLRISAGDKYENAWLDHDSFRWQIICHYGFDDLDDGDLPEGISGEVIAEAIAKPQEIFQIYEHIQKNKSNR